MAQSKKNFKIIVLVTVLLILLTRGLTISHNMELHPDEHVFFNAAQSLKGYLSGSSPIYEEVKTYPEGAIVYQLPFHIFTAILNRVFDAGISPQLSGRIAAVFYFTAGAVLGLVLIYRFFSKKLIYSIVYSLTVIFSLFHIEQSRYGTGDPISYFLLMAIILLTATALSAKRRSIFYILSATFLSGSLCAVKYPLLFFSVIPLYGLIVLLKGRSGGKKAGLIFAFVVLLYAGFACFSPKAAFDPSYILETSKLELDSYVGSASIFNLSSLYSHFMCVFTYAMLYAALPLAPVFFVAELIRHKKARSERSSLDTLLYTLIPILAIIFFTYNLFVQLVMMRAEYPFFFLCDIYAALFIGHWLTKNGAKRVISILLTAVIVLRGAYFVCYMVMDNTQERLNELCHEAVDENWNSTTLLQGFMVLPTGIHEYKNVSSTPIGDERFGNQETIELKPGELCITSVRDHYYYAYDFVSTEYPSNVDWQRWTSFTETNQQYFYAKMYPDYIYYLFGFWIYGSTGTAHEFPTEYVYYRSN